MSEPRPTRVRERDHASDEQPSATERAMVLRASEEAERAASQSSPRSLPQWIAIGALALVLGALVVAAILLLPDPIRVTLIAIGLVIFLLYDAAKRRRDWTHAAVARSFRRTTRGLLTQREVDCASADLWWLPAHSATDVRAMIEAGAAIDEPSESGRGSTESWRAFSAAMRGEWELARSAARVALAMDERLLFARLALAALARHEGDLATAREHLAGLSAQLCECDPLRTLMTALETAPPDGYRAPPRPSSGALHSSWIEAAFPMLSLTLPPFRALSADDALWNAPSPRAPTTLETASPLSELRVEIVASFEQRERDRALATLTATPATAIVDPHIERIIMRSNDPQHRLLWLYTKIEHETLSGSLDRAADAATRLEREIPTLSAHDDVNFGQLVAVRQCVCNAYAWAGRTEAAEAMLANIEKLVRVSEPSARRGSQLPASTMKSRESTTRATATGHADHARASRFECCFVLSVASGDRTRCAALADELPDDVSIDDSTWLAALAVQASTHAPSERSQVRARIEANRLCRARLRFAAPWLLDALEAQS